MKRTHVYRMVAVVLGLLVVLLVALGPATSGTPQYGQVMAQEETPVPEQPHILWARYEDKKFGFSSIVPTSWYIAPAPLVGAGGATSFTTFKPGSIPSLEDIPITEIKMDIGVAAIDKPKTTSLVDWVKENQLRSSSVLSERLDQESNHQSVEFEVVAENGQDARLWYFEHKGVVYFAIAMPGNSTHMELARRVSSSLTFSEDRAQLEVAMATRITNQVQLAAPSGYRLPFTGKKIITTGPGCYWTHTGRSSEAIDYALSFDTVYATQEGEVVFSQDGWNDGFGSLIKIQHPDGNASWHAHLNSRYVSSGRVSQGAEIAQSGNTGNSTGAHLHFEVRNSSNWSIWIRDLPTTTWYTGDINNPCMPPGQYDGEATYSGSGPQPPDCPTSGGVILYKHANYDCGGEGEGSGYVRRESTGLESYVGDGFNDQASSVRVPSGWSVKLYQDDHGHGGWACRTGDDDNFSGDYFNNGLSLNDNVSSFEVFDSPDCGQRPPNRPWPESPSDGHVAHDGRAPTLCWGNPGDPDGDPVEFYAEVYESPVNANSGWIHDTCWCPTQLDGHYHDYKWHVKARDIPHHEESDWSTTWHFTIEDPNRPPSISFDTANGNSASRIKSRERDWTFRGAASDPEGQLSEIEFRCSGDNCGSYHSRSGLGNWTYERHDMAGRNDVYFVAKDDKHSTASRRLDLRIDLAAPNTTISLNNEANPARWPAWFTDPVQVRLKADDGNTGRARSGVKEIHYRLDSGGWQTRSGSSTSFTVSDDGTHTVEYYAVDKVGNQETTQSDTFKIDQTPPSPPGGVNETHGVVSNQWQKAHNTPTFTWAASSDAASGVWGYQFYFDTDPNGVAYQTFRASDPRQWTPQPGGVRTDTYYLRGRTRDNADNWSDWINLFTFRYDGTPPENPGEAAHAAGITNDTWQNTTNLADFTWPAPHDEGSGIKGYYNYWGNAEAGESGDFITDSSFQSATPLCGENEACTGYLRLRSVDNVDNQAEDWSTAFVLRYDNAPPTADITFHGGVTQTTQTLVTLHIAANDEGSGVREMRLSGDGRNWTTWEVYAAERVWTIPGISRQSWPVYLQVRDGMELVSEVVSRTIYLDVNAGQPRSDNFRLFDHIMSAGAGEHTSVPSDYQGRSTVGQVMDSAKINSLSYTIIGGYEAGSQALPIEEPGHDEFTFINGIFASGTGAETLHSPLYQMLGTAGEVGLPNNETTLHSPNHQHQPGFLAAAPPSGTPTPTPTPGPTPTPTPTPACEFPQISINDGALFTNDPDVTLSICAPYAAEMMLSNDGGFGDAEWEPYAEGRAWTLTTYGQHVLPRFVYAAFKDTDGATHGTYFDDIIHDPNSPEGTINMGDSVPLETVLQMAGSGDVVERSPFDIGGVRYVRRLGDTVLNRPLALLSAQADGTVDIFVNAQDDNSGLAEMQISASADFSDTDWESYSALKPWTPEGGDGVKTVYARFRDDADNVSDAADASFALDTQPPFGGMAIDQRVVGPDIISTTVYLGAEDNLSGVTDLRISADPAFADIAWQPYTTTLTWPISITAQSEGTLRVQYRDLAGNASEVYSDTYLVDTTPPVVYVEVAAGDTLTRTVTVLAYDELATVETMHLSNDPLMIEEIVTLPYTDTVEWAFDERRVVWVQVEDSVGNVTEPYPAHAAIACPGDLDGNRAVNVADIMMVASRWRTSCDNPDPDNDLNTPNYEGRYDLNHDCQINIVDIMLVVVNWGETCE